MNDDWLPIVVGFVCLMTVVLFIGIGIGEKNTRQDAVRANVAEWIVDQDGYVRFKFKQ
jgi:hypothetical protein